MYNIVNSTGHEALASTSKSDSGDDVSSTTSAQQCGTPPPHGNDEEEAMMETCVDWIRRCAHDIERRMRNLKLDDWITTQRKGNGDGHAKK